MPTIRQYTQANSVVSTDAFVINRIGVGTMEIEAGSFLGGESASIYDVAMGYPGLPPTNQAILVFNAVRAFYLPAELPDSVFSCQIPPDEDLLLFFFKNEDQIGWIQFDANSTRGYVTNNDGSSFPNLVNFGPEDELKVFTPTNMYNSETFALTFVTTLGNVPQ